MATYVEIYNEQLRDLLIPSDIPAHERSPVTIREDTKGNILLTGLRQIELHSTEDMLNALNFGSAVRQTDATAINERSSRSHAVFSLQLVQKKPSITSAADKRHSISVEALSGSEIWTTTDSKMHFVDLAGSERLKNTHAEGARAKEGISINAGLAALGKVISQLSSRNAGAHVSYRDSKLTRLLQDSLGGNAITYMIACVTPPEFHLSETLNTVQYAQRARAIQSKPRIQAVDEGDKQALIDRLKAEVAFLREQVRNSERSGGDRKALGDKPERSNGREAELQNRLLDTQENYSSLSQRHAKLISEMAKARESENAENLKLGEDDIATERLNRSNNFAHAVEQVVLEYEKTIQVLEQSLSSIRSTLQDTEATLLEKESNCAYAETINAQLQARLQKLMDRETNTENYLHDLESKLDGHTSGEEKNVTIITELRKEISRVRENEAACEDYISTLEERLAEADQDSELMQREIDRLEQVIERQRSLGKLDSLLYELDHMQKDTSAPEPEIEVNGSSHPRVSRTIGSQSRSQSASGRQSQMEGPILETHQEDAAEVSVPTIQEEGPNGEPIPPKPASEAGSHVDERRASSAQSRFVQDKLENVTQELLDLRVEHEGTLTQFDLLHAKYEEAMRTLADLQDTIDEARHPHRMRDSMLSLTSPSETQTWPSSFLSEPRSVHTKDGERHLSRSLSSELSSALQSPTIVESSDTETAKPISDVGIIISDGHAPMPKAIVLAEDQTDNANLTLEIKRLQTLAAEKEAAEMDLAAKYGELAKEHHEILDMVEELKTEVAKARHTLEPPSPKINSPVIRRKSSQNVMIIDRAHRSFASLRNIAAENFEGNPETMQNFELNLNVAMHELHARSERIQELEADVANTKKEMDGKMLLISGLTRERSSMKASKGDVSLISSLKDQLERNEIQLQQLQEAHAAREKELQAEVEKLRVSMETTKVDERREVFDDSTTHDAKVTELELQLRDWQLKHESALGSMQITEQQMRTTIEELEAQLVTLNDELKETSVAPENKAAAKEAESKTEDLMSTLRSEIDGYKAIVDTHSAKVMELEQAHTTTKSELEEAQKTRDLAALEIEQHKKQMKSLEEQLEHIRIEAQQNRSEAEAHKHDAEASAGLASALENQISSHERAIKTHQQSMELLKTSHSRQLDELHNSHTADHGEKIAALKAEHSKTTSRLESELTEAREELMKVATQVAFALGLDVSVELISERIEDLVADSKALHEEQKKTEELEQAVHEISNVNDSLVQDLDQVKASLSDILMEDGGEFRSPYPTVTEQASMAKKKMVDLRQHNKKSSRLVDELEEQLQSNFDQVHATNHRMSALHDRNQQLEEALNAKANLQNQLDSLRQEKAVLEVRLDHRICRDTDIDRTQAKLHSGMHGDNTGRSDSLTGTIRKTASVSSLPSPPPAIPLPPLPGGMTGTNSGTTSPPPGAMRPPSKDVTMQQIQEDQEARIRTIEKHLSAEKQLTSTLEEALTDLERQSNKVKADCEAWRRRAGDLEAELKDLRDRPQQDNRWSLREVEEERKKREAAERARAHLEERMNALSSKKKKKGSLNCF